jgi:predicted kinase
MAGLPCSGKTTLAKKLERERAALRLSPDEWHLGLFGQDGEHPDHDTRAIRLEAMFWNIARRALELGTDVILDFGFWSREEREDYRQRAGRLGAGSELHFLDVPEAELLRRVAARNARLSNENFYVDPQKIRPWMAVFQKPAADELARREPPAPAAERC